MLCHDDETKIKSYHLGKYTVKLNIHHLDKQSQILTHHHRHHIKS